MPSRLLEPPFQIPSDLKPSSQQLLGETAHALLQDRDAETLCRTVFAIIRDVLQIESYAHYVVSADGEHLDLASSEGIPAVQVALGSWLRLGESVCGYVGQTCKPIYLPNIQARTDEMTRRIRQVGVACYVCLPLTSNGGLVGTLSFGTQRRSEFTPEDLEFFGLIAQQIRVATERRSQGERQRQLEQLALAGRMCATLAHEISNPLSSLSNLIYLLTDEVTSEDGRECIRMAESQIERLTEISQRTLNQFRDPQQRSRSLSLSETVAEVLAGICLPNGIQVVSHVLDELSVEAIPGELRQVLFNLLINAAQFSPPGQNVTVTVRRSGAFAEIVVRDEGAGISESRRANLFTPFYTTRANGGTGIGLWISREMIERVGGTLDFKSNPAVAPGTEFIVCLPLPAG